MKLIRYYLPLNVKHVLGPQNEFGIQKILGQFTKFTVWEKIQNNSVFFYDGVP